MVSQLSRRLLGIRMCLLALSALSCLYSGAAYAQAPMALVPTRIIYPGEVLSREQFQSVEVTNPNIAGGYASDVGQVEGLVTKQTLLPGRTIPIAALKEPAAVTRGGSVRLIFTLGSMMVSASGSPLTDGTIGEVIRVRNIDSGVIVSGTVMSDGTIQVMVK